MGANVCPLKYSELLPTFSLTRSATSKALVDLTVEESSPPVQVQVEFVAPKDFLPSEPSLPPKALGLAGHPTSPRPTEPPSAPEPTKHISMPSTSPATPGLL